MVRLKTSWLPSRRTAQEAFSIQNSSGLPTRRRENFSPARTGALMQGPFRLPDRRMQVGSLQCSTAREVLRDLQIAWKLLQTTFVPPCFPAQHQ